MIRKGTSRHMGFAFSGDDQGSTMRSLTIVNNKNGNQK